MKKADPTLRFKESDIVNLIKDKEHLFGDIGDSSLVFEKAIMRGKTIMDCMICTEKKGIIGIEIKTERDSTQRLNKQLENYSKVCDYVYVMCHDSHVPKVEEILERKKYTHVGIIAYVQVGIKPFVGIYKPATKSPLKDVYYVLDILWKAELVTILGTFRHPAKRIEQASNGAIKSYTMDNRDAGVPRSPIVPVSSRKSVIISAVRKWLGDDNCNKLYCEVMMNNYNSPEKAIRIEHFRRQEPLDTRGDLDG